MGDLDDILRQLEPALGSVGGAPAPLEGGITNRNFRAMLGGEEYVVRLHGKDTNLLGISRAAELLANRAAAELGTAPAVAASFDGGLVTRFLTCTALTPAEIRARAGEIAAALRAFHESGVDLPVTFNVPGLLDEYAANIRARRSEPPSGYAEIVAVAGRIAAVGRPAALKPCHNDLLAGNLILADGGVMIVDWEYAGMGDPYFDLGNLAVNNEFAQADEIALLAAYHGAPPTPAQLARLRLAQINSDAREAAWGVMQGELSALEFDFRGYAGEHLERLLAASAGERLERLLGEAAGA